MIISQYVCPNCGITLSDKFPQKQILSKLILDKQYNYNVVETNCHVCNKDIKIFILNQIVVLWDKSQQYTYNYFVVNKNYNIVKNKKFLYLYYPIRDKRIFNSIIANINFDKIDSIIIPQFFYQYLQNKFDKQFCVIPSHLFDCINGTIIPNYFVQQIILRQMEKFQDSEVYSSYSSFLNKFNILFQQKNWKKINKQIIQLNKE